MIRIKSFSRYIGKYSVKEVQFESLWHKMMLTIAFLLVLLTTSVSLISQKNLEKERKVLIPAQQITVNGWTLWLIPQGEFRGNQDSVFRCVDFFFSYFSILLNVYCFEEDLQRIFTRSRFSRLWIITIQYWRARLIDNKCMGWWFF